MESDEKEKVILRTIENILRETDGGALILSTLTVLCDEYLSGAIYRIEKESLATVERLPKMIRITKKDFQTELNIGQR